MGKARTRARDQAQRAAKRGDLVPKLSARERWVEPVRRFPRMAFGFGACMLLCGVGLYWLFTGDPLRMVGGAAVGILGAFWGGRIARVLWARRIPVEALRLTRRKASK